ncbi:transcriptional regulator [Prauserella sp. PE36]|uniref:winged helix-turn-helix transcriptional regulator n=1 Tax=Prauserella sp. PE36 TaxID=1504709 RepID=UPI000D855270|nr:winged helix-turn-helix transcriptional regulator [Prauserella sp. PE36]PXY34510.1 HxlR family transcriptional regulator [Prauserella coralliicola]RBM13032.1 transcriptional regulator [Prauserella sp. PE36]
MGKRHYGQFCGLAHAADLVGERWALLIIRDLLVAPKRFTDLRRGLPKIPTNVLSARLKQLEGEGVVERRVLPRPDGSVVYELTEYGRDLEDIVLALGRWGARTLGEPGPDDIVTPDSMVMAMRSTFRAEDARDVVAGFELRLGDVVVGVRVDNGKLDVAEGELTGGADVTISTGPAIKAVMAGELTPEEAVANGSVHVDGNEALFPTFAKIFRI